MCLMIYINSNHKQFSQDLVKINSISIFKDSEAQILAVFISSNYIKSKRIQTASNKDLSQNYFKRNYNYSNL